MTSCSKGQVFIALVNLPDREQFTPLCGVARRAPFTAQRPGVTFTGLAHLYRPSAEFPIELVYRRHQAFAALSFFICLRGFGEGELTVGLG